MPRQQGYLIIRKGLSKTVLLLIRGYQFFISPIFGPVCRFYPSCSEYAHEAILRHGPGKGSWLALLRLLRCHPFHPGGVDPVP